MRVSKGGEERREKGVTFGRGGDEYIRWRGGRRKGQIGRRTEGANEEKGKKQENGDCG